MTTKLTEQIEECYTARDAQLVHDAQQETEAYLTELLEAELSAMLAEAA